MFRYSCIFTFMRCQRKLVSCPMLETEGTVATFRVRYDVQVYGSDQSLQNGNLKWANCSLFSIVPWLEPDPLRSDNQSHRAVVSIMQYFLRPTSHMKPLKNKTTMTIDEMGRTCETIGCMITLPTYDHALSLLLRVDVSALNNRVQCTSCMRNQY